VFSVIVSARGDDPALPALLEALERQAFPRERFELLLALESGEPAPDVAARVAGLGRLVAGASGGGAGAARNAAAALARFDWLAFTVPDARPGDAWLAAAAERIGAAPAPDALVGRVLAPDGAERTGGFPACVAANCFVLRERFRRVGGWHAAWFVPPPADETRAGADLFWALEEIHSVIAALPEAVVVREEPRLHPLEPLRWAAAHHRDARLASRHPRLHRERYGVHRWGPLRVRQPELRACLGVLLALALTAALVVAGRGAQAPPLLAIALLLELVVWARWRFHPLVLPAALLAPFALAWALARGAVRGGQ
jgi:hypothetical protein